MPEWKQHVRRHLTSLHLTPTREDEILEELAQHLDDRWREARAGGASEAEATRLTLALLRDTTLTKNLAPLRQSQQPPPVTPGASTGHCMSDLWRDVRYAARLLRRQPGFAATAVLTLALGLGSATALFVWADHLFLRPLPVSEPDRLFNLGETSESGRVRMAFSYPEYLAYQRHRAFAGLVAFDPRVAVELETGTGAEHAQAALVSTNFFAVLGVRPILGRTFDPDADLTPGAYPVTVLSYSAWQRLFSGDREVVGRTLRLNGHSFTIIGVAPRDFTGLMRGVFPSLFVPVSMLGQARPSWSARPLTDPDHIWLAATARLPVGTGPEQAGEVATASAGSLSRANRRLVLLPGSRGRGDSVQPIVSAGRLFTAASFVLLAIVCANVSGLFLARSVGRQREFATRLALGASRASLIRHSLIEAMLTSVLGGALGLVWARGLVGMLQRLLPTAPTPPTIDTRSFGFVWLLMLATTVIVGVVPALHVARAHTLGSLRNRAAVTGWRHASWQRGLVVAQLTLCLTALVVAGLCLRSGARLAAVDTGIDDSNIVLATFDASAAGYSPERGALFYEALRERVAMLPGTASVSLTHLVPFEGRNDSRTLGVPGYSPAPGEDMNVSQNWVAPDYFATIGVRVLQGREFRSTDLTGAPGVVVVNEALARRFWPGEDPVGKNLSYGGAADLQVVGLVKDHRARTPSEQPRPMIYLPYLQRYQAVLTLVARTNRDAGGYVAEIRDAARSLDRAVLPYNLRTLATERKRSFAMARYTTEISFVFGALCLIVGGVGLYGVLAQAVARRTREIALRMALGATRSGTVGLVVRDAMALVGCAFVPGLVSALAASHLMKSMLYESRGADLSTVSLALLCLTIAAFIAAWRPARWAANVDPIVALREE
jgi:macrolide transport system ATP-binding/permease protein